MCYYVWGEKMDNDKRREYLVTKIEKYNEERKDEFTNKWFIYFLIVLFIIIRDINFNENSEEIQFISESIIKNLSTFGLAALLPEGIICFIKSIIRTAKQIKLEFELDKLDDEKSKIKYKQK